MVLIMNYNIVSIILSTLTTSYIMLNYLQEFYKPKLGHKMNFVLSVCAFILFSCIITIANIYNIAIINLLLNYFLFNIISYLLYTTSSVKRMFIMNSCFFSILVLLDSSIHFGIEFALQFTNNNYIVNDIDIFLKNIVLSISLISLYSLIKSFLVKNKEQLMESGNIVLTIFFPIYSLLIIYLIIILNDGVYNKFISALIFIVCLGLLLLNIYLIKLYEFLYKNNQLKLKIKTLSDVSEMQLGVYQLLQIKQQEMDYQIHDFIRHIQTVNQLFSLNQNDDAQNYSNQLYDMLNDNDTLFHSENKILEILVNDKISVAKKRGVLLTFECNSLATLDNIADIDLVMIFSNLLDNAIDAASECNEKKIQLEISDYNGYIIIIVTNPYKSLNKNKDGNFISNKKHHNGYGLKIIENTIKKYNGNLTVDFDGFLFKVTIIIPID